MAVKLTDKIKNETPCCGLKLRIYTNQEQTILINKTFGCCRTVYYQRIAEKQAFYEKIIKLEIDSEKRKNLWKTDHFPRVKELKSQCPYLVEPTANRYLTRQCRRKKHTPLF